MKRISTLLIPCLFASVSYTQDTAEDWTQIDCDGVEHHLFTELDAGNCVIMEFVMATGCVPCITAAENIGPLVDEYNALYDNRVKYYTFDYDDGLTCEDMLGWAAEYSLNPTAVFNNGTDILAYYGSMGMPTIVIVGGVDHAVEYEKMGFTVSQMENIEASILEALGIEDTTETAILSTDAVKFTIYPNPAAETVIISGNNYDQLVITDINGQIMEQMGHTIYSTVGTSTSTVDITHFPDGVYFIQIVSNSKLYTEKFVVNH